MKKRTAVVLQNSVKLKEQSKALRKRIARLVRECKNAGIGEALRIGLAEIEKRKKAENAETEMEEWRKREYDEIGRRQHAETKLTVRVDAFNWGILNMAALINGCTPVEALESFIEGGNRMNDWWDQSCPLNDLVIPDPQTGEKP